MGKYSTNYAPPPPPPPPPLYSITMKAQAKTCSFTHYILFNLAGILKSASPNMFDVAKNRLEVFQQKYPMKQLVTWWTWWERRKWHVFRTFRPSLHVPGVNLAESGHSSWKNSGTVYLDLLGAARQDVAENLQLQSISPVL